MVNYQAPVRHTLFLLRDVLGYERYANLPGFSDAPLDLVEAILDEGGRFCEDILTPLNRLGDEAGCRRHDDGSVTTPAGFREAYETYAGAGWVGLAADPAYGGQGLPYTLAVILNEFATAANMAWSMYPGLSQGAIAALQKHGSPAQKQTYLPRLISGAWSGTMNLTEPHCGTDLGLIKTRARAAGDGAYTITGQKIFISAGEHNLAENIVHLVLARIEGAPDGTKGISLFVVPKFLPDGDGIGARNGVSCGSIEEKMGIHGNATCTMNYDDATGWLVGEENRGLAAMFTMMNEARLGVATQGLALSEVARQNAAAYARERRQGRALSGAAEPDEAADPILVHPDVRRSLLDIMAFNGAARALLLWTALQADIAARADDEANASEAEDLVGLMTPVLKGVLTDRGFDNAVAAQQVFGGHGYIRESGMEQFVRDARIAMVYEGTNGIQALDLVGRKLAKDGGRAAMAFFSQVEELVKTLESAGPELALLAPPLRRGLDDLQGATVWFMNNAMAKPDNAGAGASDYMHLFGLVALGYMWGRIAMAVAEKGSGSANGEAAFSQQQQTLARYFMERSMPETMVRRARVEAGANTLLALPADQF